ncbi:MAG: hypothetical protein SOX25_05965 [Eubacteriales bacterium]|nr:hypothetical protein [Eubacteriales bacterium]
MFGYGYQPGYFAPGQPMPDQLSQLRMGQQPMQPMQQQPQPQQQNQSGLIWVQGEAGAKSYMVANGNSVLLMDSESQTFYLKSADASGMPSMRVFDYHERAAQKPQPMQETGDKNYVTREEFNALAARMDAMTAKPVKKQKEVTTDEPTV